MITAPCPLHVWALAKEWAVLSALGSEALEGVPLDSLAQAFYDYGIALVELMEKEKQDAGTVEEARGANPDRAEHRDRGPGRARR